MNINNTIIISNNNKVLSNLKRPTILHSHKKTKQTKTYTL